MATEILGEFRYDAMMRRPKFSLKIALVAVAVVALLLGRVTKQQRVAKQLRALDARITYRFQYDRWDDVDRYSFNNQNAQSGLAKRLGPDLCDTIVSVSSTKSKSPGEIAELTAHLPQLRSLAIQETLLKDQDLRPLLHLGQLRGLYLRGTAITDSSVETFSKMTYLKVLNLRNTELSEEAIGELRAALPDTRIHTGEYSGGFM